MGEGAGERARERERDWEGLKDVTCWRATFVSITMYRCAVWDNFADS